MSSGKPVLFIIFSRPETTARVFAAIREARPPRLYVAADGARPDRPGEAGACAAARAAATAVDWPCEVKTLFREKNLGCKGAVSSAISWFFEHEEEGIILEDDCLPDGSFFDYCGELLERYRNDEKVMHIGGANFQDGISRGSGSYYFSAYAHVWGWASWRRAWKRYNLSLEGYAGRKLFLEVFGEKAPAAYWEKVMQGVRDGKVNTWDYQWLYSIWASGGLAVVPNTNLITNIGFGQGSTHLANAASRFANMPRGSLNQPLSHPASVVKDLEADAYTFRHHYSRPLAEKIMDKLRNAL